MTRDNDDVFNDDTKNTTQTGRDLPNGDGTVGDEDINAIDVNDDAGKPTGQDHSLDNYGDSMPTSGVGAIQNSSDTTSDIAHLDAENEENEKE